jgi:hypothetical protein
MEAHYMSDRDLHSSNGFSRSSAYPFAIAESVSPPDDLDTGSGAGDVKRIARGIFTAELADLIAVLRNCGALRTRTECFWAVKEVWRLLKPGPDDAA